jgi:integration host factor subunit beta
VTKSELIAALAARYSQLAARDTDYAVKTVLDAMTQALAEGQRIEIRGFGSFSLSERAPRVGRNPKSGEQVLVPGKQVPHFKAGKELRERVDLSGAESDQAHSDTQLPASEVDLGVSLIARRVAG